MLKKVKPILCWLQPFVPSQWGQLLTASSVHTALLWARWFQPPSGTSLPRQPIIQCPSFRASLKPLSPEWSFSSCYPSGLSHKAAFLLASSFPGSLFLSCWVSTHTLEARVYTCPCFPGPSLTVLWNSKVQACFIHSHNKPFLVEGAFIHGK